MNLLSTIKQKILSITDVKESVLVNLNVDKSRNFGDLSCNAALVLAKKQKSDPREVAQELQEKFLADNFLKKHVKAIEVAGPGFINISLKESTWKEIAKEIDDKKESFFKLDKKKINKSFLIEFVSANPTGPLHLGHGRGGIIGDVLANILKFLGYKADKEFYINDAGSQIAKLGRSLKIRCEQKLGKPVEFPEDGYAGGYVVEMANACVEHYGKKILEEAAPPMKDDQFFQDYAKDELLEKIKLTLDSYGITFDRWFSETQLHKGDKINKAIELLREKNLVYEKDDATWFKSTDFGDDKDRVIKKADGSFTYIAADIAYHQDKFDRGYKKLINILGQDHHGYVKRLKGTMAALGHKPDSLDVILYQLVSLKHKGEQVKMSKRAGTFETLCDIIEKVGKDVARFFYLNRKADAHLDFDLEIALKKTDANPVYYIQYGYVRTNSLLKKALESNLEPNLDELGEPEIFIVKKICSLREVLKSISGSYQTHQLAYYTLELAKNFHSYYAKNKIIDQDNVKTSQSRLFMTKLVQETIGVCLDLLGISKPEKM